MKVTTAQTKKGINLALFLSFLLGYMEWGNNYHIFIIQAEGELFSKLISNPLSVLHPFTLIPFAGQIILVFTLFQKEPGKRLTFTGLACLSLLMVFLFFIGLFGMRLRILASVIPFITLGIFAVVYYRKNNKTASSSYKTHAD